MKQVLLRTPKKKGFKSSKPKDQVVNLILINKYFKDKDKVCPKSLLAKGLIDNIKTGVKILGKGRLGLKGLQFEDVKMSESVKEQIKKISEKRNSEGLTAAAGFRKGGRSKK